MFKCTATIVGRVGGMLVLICRTSNNTGVACRYELEKYTAATTSLEYENIHLLGQKKREINDKKYAGARERKHK